MILPRLSGEKNAAGEIVPAFTCAKPSIACWLPWIAPNNCCISGGGGAASVRRLNRWFLPLLYNRRDLGVMMFKLALGHVVMPTPWSRPSASDALT
jgi:hypothetical protein